MKSALLVSARSDLFSLVSSALIDDGADYTDGAGGVVQVTGSSGRMLTVYGDAESERRELSHVTLAWPEGAVVETSQLSACVVECRWEDLFAETMARLAALVPAPVWVIDGNDVVWPAAHVDPARVSL